MKSLIAATCLLAAGCSDIQPVTVIEQVPVTSEPNGAGIPDTILIVKTEDDRMLYDLSDLPIGFQFETGISGRDEISHDEYLDLVGIELIEMKETQTDKNSTRHFQAVEQP